MTDDVITEGETVETASQATSSPFVELSTMGTTCSAASPTPVAPLPFPATMEGFQVFPQRHLLHCLKVLKRLAEIDSKKPANQQLGGAYGIQINTGVCGPTPDGDIGIVITAPATEALSIIDRYFKALEDGKQAVFDAAKRKEAWEEEHYATRSSVSEAPAPEATTTDSALEQRIFSALFRARRLVLGTGIRFSGPINLTATEHMTRLPLAPKELGVLTKLFTRLDKSKNGLLSVEEFGDFFESGFPGMVHCLFFKFIFDLVKCQSKQGACVEEFVGIINKLCTMNEEEILRHVFACLAQEEDDEGEKYFDLSTMNKRFPSLYEAESSKNLENRTFVKEVHDLLEYRRKNCDPSIEAASFRLHLKDFIGMTTKSQHLLHSLEFCQSRMRRMFLGEKFWAARELLLRGAENGKLADRNRRKSIALTYFVQQAGMGLSPLPYKMVPLTEGEAKSMLQVQAKEVSKQRSSVTAANVARQLAGARPAITDHAKSVLAEKARRSSLTGSAAGAGKSIRVQAMALIAFRSAGQSSG